MASSDKIVLPQCLRFGLGGLIFNRRILASLQSRGVFLLAGFHLHGVVRSSFMGKPCGTPSGVLFPVEQSANPHGFAHHLGGWLSVSDNSSTGVTP